MGGGACARPIQFYSDTRDRSALDNHQLLEVTVKKFLLIVSVCIAAAGASRSALAGSRLTFYSGTLCQPINVSRDNVDYSHFGVNNLSSSVSVIVECPLQTTSFSLPETVTTVGVVTYDRHTLQNVSCTLTASDSAGNIQWQDTKTTSGGGAGTGAVGLAFFPNQAINQVWSLRCTLPAIQTSGWPSHTTSISMTSSF
jgi:hypothetical protein